MKQFLTSSKTISFLSVGFLFLVSIIFFSQASLAADTGEVTYGAGSWDAASLGNHRAVIRVEQKSDAVRVFIPWRRRDLKPRDKNIIIVDAESGKKINNVFRAEINRESGDLIFQPVTVPGDYYVYYMPYITSGRSNYPTVTYPKPMETAQASWLKRHGLTGSDWQRKKWPRAKLLRIEAIDRFNSFYPMEVIATAAETKALLGKHPDVSYLLFPEDRAYPIRMKRDLPLRWIKKGVTGKFTGEARRGEFYAFQVGLYAFKEAISDIRVQFSDLSPLPLMPSPRGGAGGKINIPAAALRCFNTGGIDWTGRELRKVCPVKKGEIQTLWCGVQVPRDLQPGLYRGEVAILPAGLDNPAARGGVEECPSTPVDSTTTPLPKAENCHPVLEKKVIKLELQVSDKVLEDAGDSQPWRHSRLRWLDSRIALDDGIVPPFTPLKIAGSRVACLGRDVTFGKRGFPRSIRSFFAPEMTHIQPDQGREILAAPVNFVVEDTRGRVLSWQGKGAGIVKQAEGAAAWEARASGRPGGLALALRARMEFDGCVEYEVKLSALETTAVKDIRLEIPVKKDVAKYMMGMGFKGGKRPARFDWQWNWKHNQDSLWIGDVNAGLQCSFKDEKYVRPLNTNFYLSKPLVMPVSWSNAGRGGCRLRENGEDAVLISVYSGPRKIEKGEALYFNFRLLVTPFKPLDTRSHWRSRYYHRFEPIDKIAAAGANTINVHHATEINPFINYPFMRPKEMKAYIDEAHSKKMKVKIYYTVRELSNIAPEIFALRSLGDEILSYGPGGGFSWLQEHLGGSYIAGWLVPRLKDAAVINSGTSRWHNYYLEGLAWLVKHVGIDGLYIDDVAFDRVVMQRVRKILDRGRQGALIDLHSANQYNVRDGYASSANLYLEHFPYLNRLWFGEYFDYNAAPDYWLIEMSGIPFGLMGEMLQDGGNPWRGMVYGMTARLPWAGDPTAIWKVWENFGIEESKMAGYWAPSCPVKTGRPDVLATAYVKKDKTLVALASWAKEEVGCELSVDWKYLGLAADRVEIFAPAVKDFQREARFRPGDKIPLSPGRGWLLIIKSIE